ncbi:hypothetical protein FOG18_05950 [Legionella israelensis]|uniref:DUF6429 family protein n=1 Tax=Legionella israelensis TaxID=454 RepID=UPI00117D27BB|nr:DUF6429 family protein [Legionella israelensis]QDP72136.1 hypothetical protein FOG18_05950 [Legionella israelensis]
MKYDQSKIDEMVMSLLYLSSFDNGRVWKGYDWDILERLHKKGLITDPVGKAKSFYLSDEGMKLGKELAHKFLADESSS